MPTFWNLCGGRKRIGPLGAIFHRKVMRCKVFVSKSCDFSRDIFQLSNVSRPRVLQQQAHCGVADIWLRPLEQRGIFLEEEFQQAWNVLFSISQPRQPDMNSADPVIQLFTESAAPHLVLEISCCG